MVLANKYIGYTFKNDSKYRADATLPGPRWCLPTSMGYTFKNDSKYRADSTLPDLRWCWPTRTWATPSRMTVSTELTPLLH